MSFAFTHWASLFWGSGPVQERNPTPSPCSASSFCCWLSLMDSCRNFFGRNLCDAAALRKVWKQAFFLYSCFCTGLAQSGKHSAKVYLRVWFLMGGQNHSQDHLWSEITPDGTSISCLGQTHEVEYVKIDLGVFMVWRITEIMLNIKPCSLDDKQPHNAVHHNTQKRGRSRSCSDYTYCRI